MLQIIKQTNIRCSEVGKAVASDTRDPLSSATILNTIKCILKTAQNRQNREERGREWLMKNK